jgi:hypothetical protein
MLPAPMLARAESTLPVADYAFEVNGRLPRDRLDRGREDPRHDERKMREAVTERDEFGVEMPRTSSRASSGISGVMFQPRRLRTGNPDTPDSHSKANGRGCGWIWARLDSNQGPTDYESAALTS